MIEQHLTGVVLSAPELEALMAMLPANSLLQAKLELARIQIEAQAQWTRMLARQDAMRKVIAEVAGILHTDGGTKVRFKVRDTEIELTGLRREQYRALTGWLASVNEAMQVACAAQLEDRFLTLADVNERLTRELAQLRRQQVLHGQDGTDYKGMLKRLEDEVKELSGLLDNHGVPPGTLPCRLEHVFQRYHAPTNSPDRRSEICLRKDTAETEWRQAMNITHHFGIPGRTLTERLLRYFGAVPTEVLEKAETGGVP